MITTIINLTVIATPSGRGAAMIIESLRLFYHIRCFKCCVCRYPQNNANYIFLIFAIVVSLHPFPSCPVSMSLIPLKFVRQLMQISPSIWLLSLLAATAYCDATAEVVFARNHFSL